MASVTLFYFTLEQIYLKKMMCVLYSVMSIQPSTRLPIIYLLSLPFIWLATVRSEPVLLANLSINCTANRNTALGNVQAQAQMTSILFVSGCSLSLDAYGIFRTDNRRMVVSCSDHTETGVR